MLARLTVLRRAQPVLALLGVLCMVAGIVVQAPRGCAVCPVGCPMHSARPSGPGCHMAAAPAPRAPEPPSRCALRATCGHVEDAVVAMPAVPPARGAVVATQRVYTPQPSVSRRPELPAPEPAGHPPQLLRV